MSKFSPINFDEQVQDYKINIRFLKPGDTVLCIIGGRVEKADVKETITVSRLKNGKIHDDVKYVVTFVNKFYQSKYHTVSHHEYCDAYIKNLESLPGA